MRKYVPRPGSGDRRIVRRSTVTKDVSRGQPHGFVKRHRTKTVGSAPRTQVRRVRGLAAPARAAAGCAQRVNVPAIIAVVLLAGLVGGGAWLWQSPLLEVKRVEVVGTTSVRAEEVIRVAGLEGQRMVSVDLGTAQREVGELALVRTVKAERRWPNTIVLSIEERVPWGTWEQAGVSYAIDREGVVLGAFPADPGQPYVISAEPSSLRQGDRVSYQAVDAVAEIYELLPRELGTGVHQVAFLPGKGVQVSTEDGQTALLGDSSSIAYKLAVWVAVEAEAERARLSYETIDLRWGNKPVLQ